MHYSDAYKGALAIQRVLQADACKDETPSQVKATLAKAFVELELLKLRLRMKPAPKPVDVGQDGKRRAHRTGDSLLAE